MPDNGRRRRVEETHSNHERWMVSYADMVTLLMALFIILFAMSQVDVDKFERVARSLASGFGQVVSNSEGSMSLLPETGQTVALTSYPVTDVVASIAPEVMPPLERQITQMMQQQMNSEAVQTSREMQEAQVAAELDAEQLNAAQAAITDAMGSSIQAGKTMVTREERGIVVTVVVDEVIFQAHRANLLPEGQEIITSLVPALKQANRRLIIEGHTNTAPVDPIYYPSEWELSSARASSVARYLTSAHGIKENRMYVVGYGDTAPLVPETNPDHLRLNRRVAIVISSSLTEEQRALAAQAEAIGDASEMAMDPVMSP